MTRTYINYFVAPLVLSLLLLSGCGGQKVVAPINSDSKVKTETNQEVEDLVARAFDYMHRVDEFEPETIDKQINYFLSRWLDVNREAQKSWQPDDLLEKVSSQATALVSRKELRRRHVTKEDIRYIKECVWLKTMASWAVERAPKASSPKLVTAHKGEEASQLIEAVRLFEWTMRNIQLIPLPKTPQTILGGNQEPRWRSRDGQGGPGYRFYPWQTIVRGQGDEYERARVFMLLARQRGITTVLLAKDATPEGVTVKKVQPWLPGVIIGNKIHLFDTKLGLPIPGKTDGSIATLDELQSDPSLLQALNIGSTFSYRMSAADLKKVVVLLNVSAQSMARRWHAIEANLAGKHKTVITQQPSRIVKRLKACKGKYVDLQYWQIPFENAFYRRRIDKSIRTNPGFARTYYIRFPVFRPGPIREARLMHLSGKFENTETKKKGAKALYMDMRVSDKFAERLYSDTRVQRRLKVRRDPKFTDAQWRSAVLAYRVQLTKNKMRASYWIGLIHMESGNYKAAAKWLSVRLLDKYEITKQGDPCPWRVGATYNYARALEAMGKFAEARNVLLRDETIGRHGSLVRARLLTKRIKQ